MKLKNLFILFIISVLAINLGTGDAVAKPNGKPVLQPTVTLAEPVTLKTSDDWTLSALYLAPEAEENPTVVLLHDLGKNKEAFDPLAKALAQEGMGYLAVDLRGYGASAGEKPASTFAREGEDNPFNQMTLDVAAALAFLRTKKIPAEQTVVLGVGLGANVAVKSTLSLPAITHLGLINPSVNIRDVLAVEPMRHYKGDVLIAASADDKKSFLEASILRNVAYLTIGPDSGKVTFLTAYDKTSHEMLNQHLIPTVMQWLKTPQRPPLAPDEDESAATPEFQPPLQD